MKASRSIAAGSIAVLLFALVGCGDSEDKNKPLSAEDFKTKVVAICEATSTEIQKLNPGAGATKEATDNAYRAVGALFVQQVEKIEKLEPPKDIAADVDSLLKSISEAGEAIKEKGVAADKEASAALQEAKTKGTDLGLDACFS